MDSRRAYQQRYELQLKVWGAKLDELAARQRTLPAERQPAAALTLVRAMDQYNKSRSRLAALALAYGAEWDEEKRKADTAWYWLRCSIDDVLALL